MYTYRFKAQTIRLPTMTMYITDLVAMNQTHPHLILVKLNRVLDMANILSNNSNYPSTINIKSDLSLEESSCESKLLAKRWHIIQFWQKINQNIRPSIYLYVNRKLHSKVRNSVFVNADQLPMETNTNTIAWLGNWLSALYWNTHSLVNQLHHFQSFILSN